MPDRNTIDFLSGLNEQLAAENQALKVQLKSAAGGGTSGGMDLTTYRLDQAEKRAEAADGRMARIEDKLSAIQVTLAGLATKDAIRNWGVAVVAIVLATGIGVGAVLLQSSGNQLTAFQSGLSAIQAVVAASQTGPKEPSFIPQREVPSAPPQLPHPLVPGGQAGQH